MIFGLSGSQLFGVGLAVIGMVVLAFSGRYVWRTTGIYRAEAVSTLGETAPGRSFVSLERPKRATRTS